MRELLGRIDSAELSEWMAFSRIEPFEDGYWQAAVIASTMATCWGKKAYRVEDFLPVRRDRGERWREQTPAEQRAILGAAVALATAKAASK